jgi:hypothetical protein
LKRKKRGVFDYFCPHFVDLLKQEYPTETASKLVERLVGMWSLHKNHSGYDSRCTNDCPCQGDWVKLFRRGNVDLAQSLIQASRKRPRTSPPFETSIPLGGYFVTNKDSAGKTECWVFSKFPNGQMARDKMIQAGIMVLAVILDGKTRPIASHKELKSYYEMAKKHNRKLELVLESKDSNHYFDNSSEWWSRNGSWVGSTSDGWAGGATKAGTEQENSGSGSCQLSSRSTTILNNESPNGRSCAAAKVSRNDNIKVPTAPMTNNSSQSLSSPVEPPVVSSQKEQLALPGSGTSHVPSKQTSVNESRENPIAGSKKAQKGPVACLRPALAATSQLSSSQTSVGVCKKYQENHVTGMLSVSVSQLLESRDKYPRNADDVNGILLGQYNIAKDEFNRLKNSFPSPKSKSQHKLLESEAKYHALKIYMDSINVIEKVTAHLNHYMYLILSTFWRF